MLITFQWYHIVFSILALIVLVNAFLIYRYRHDAILIASLSGVIIFFVSLISIVQILDDQDDQILYDWAKNHTEWKQLCDTLHRCSSGDQKAIVINRFLKENPVEKTTPIPIDKVFLFRRYFKIQLLEPYVELK